MTPILLQSGMWLTRLFHFRKLGRTKTVQQYLVGIFPTAQEAFIQGNRFAENNEELFRENSDGKCPDRMVIELLDNGVYPKCIKHQMTFHFFPDQCGPYMDTEGVTRPSYMLTQEKKIKHLFGVTTRK